MPFRRALDIVMCNHEGRYKTEIRDVLERQEDYCLAENYAESDLVCGDPRCFPRMRCFESFEQARNFVCSRHLTYYVVVLARRLPESMELAGRMRPSN